MKEKWLKDIHNQMTDYEVDEPENLWEHIQVKMVEEKNKRNRAIALLWTKRLASAAAIVFLLFSVGQYWGKNTDVATTNTTDVSAGKISKQEYANQNISSASTTNNEVISAEKNTTKNTTEKMVSSEKITSAEKTTSAGKSVSAEKTTSAGKSISAGKTASAEKMVSAEKKSLRDTKQTSQNKSISDASKVALTHKNIQVATIKTNNTLTESIENKPQSRTSEETLLEEIAQITPDKTPKRMSLGVFTSGGVGSSQSSKSVYQNVSPSNDDPGDSGDSTWQDSPLLGALSNQEQVETKAEHQVPIRAGLSFSYDISNRFGIESGITYAYLSSDIREGSGNLYFTSRQELHYIGIPLKLRYKILDTRGFELYSSIGVLSEKNISGTSKKTYFFDNQVTQTENEKVKISPWQWSANTSVGVQYNFSSVVGIYAEPGVSYFFKNNSPVETVYTDKPFNFSLGLRFSLGR